MFQSLIGILVNCNIKVLPHVVQLQVSIPNRDFGELQSDTAIAILTGASFNVSIPNRDFGELQ